jgi:hypothetical protein
MGLRFSGHGNRRSQSRSMMKSFEVLGWGRI